VISIEKWAGLATNASPYSLPPGAAVTQVNLQCISPGKLNVRPGAVPVTLASHTGSTAPVVRMFRYPRDADRIVYQGDDGAIRVGRSPA
jgi:hypothetical protein